MSKRLEVDCGGGEQGLHLHLGPTSELRFSHAVLLFGIGVDALTNGASAFEEAPAAAAAKAVLHLLNDARVPASRDHAISGTGSALRLERTLSTGALGDFEHGLVAVVVLADAVQLLALWRCCAPDWYRRGWRGSRSPGTSDGWSCSTRSTIRTALATTHCGTSLRHFSLGSFCCCRVASQQRCELSDRVHRLRPAFLLPAPTRRCKHMRDVAVLGLLWAVAVRRFRAHGRVGRGRTGPLTANRWVGDALGQVRTRKALSDTLR